MPHDEDGLRQLSDSIRHQGHIAEVPQAGHNSWTRGTGKGSSSFWSGNDDGYHDSHTWPVCDDSESSYSTNWDGFQGEWSQEETGEERDPLQDANHFYEHDDEGWPSCSTCGAYADESDNNDTDTEPER